MEKSREAFRTISEVADLLDTPAHVLRFWESRFPQIRPVKRAGGRRYYRPTDVALLSGIKQLLHRDGLTIRGVQKILREHGIRHVMGLADGSFADALAASAPASGPQAVPVAEVLPFPGAPAPTQPAEDLPLWSATAAPEPADPAEAWEQPARPEAGTAAEPVVDALPLEEPAAEAAPAPVAAATAPPPVEPASALPEPAPGSAPGSAPESAPGSVPGSEPADGPAEPVDEAATDWIPTRLRALDPGRARRNRAELVAISARLQELRARMASAAGADRR